MKFYILIIFKIYNLVAFSTFTPPPNPWQPLIYFLSTELPILFHVSGIIYYVVFRVGFIHSVLCLQGPSMFQHQHFIPFMAKEYSIAWISHICLSIHQWKTSRLFPLLGSCEYLVAMNICVQVFV